MQLLLLQEALHCQQRKHLAMRLHLQHVGQELVHSAEFVPVLLCQQQLCQLQLTHVNLGAVLLAVLLGSPADWRCLLQLAPVAQCPCEEPALDQDREAEHGDYWAAVGCWAAAGPSAELHLCPFVYRSPCLHSQALLHAQGRSPWPFAELQLTEFLEQQSCYQFSSW